MAALSTGWGGVTSLLGGFFDNQEMFAVFGVIVETAGELGAEQVAVVFRARGHSVAGRDESGRPSSRFCQVDASADPEAFRFVEADPEGVLQLFHQGGNDGVVDQSVVVKVGAIGARFEGLEGDGDRTKGVVDCPLGVSKNLVCFFGGFAEIVGEGLVNGG
jgi:hypothetical protein